MAADLIVATGVEVVYGTRRGLFGDRPGTRVLHGVDVRVGRGETVGIVGESGSGKTTLGRALIRLVEPSAGRIVFDGTDVTHMGEDALRPLRRRMQMIFQDPYASLNPRMTVGEIVGEPLMLHGVAQGTARAEKVRELLSVVGLRPEHDRRYPHEFSGGQRQRIGIARALAAGPKLIVGDEPVSALDVSVQAQVLNLLKDLQAKFGMALVLIAHDLAVVKHAADRVAVMYLGRIVEIADKAELYSQPRHPYTQALLAAIPVPDPSVARNRTLLEGDVPSPLAPPPGCHFHTRCAFAKDRCRRESPQLAFAGKSHSVACHFWREIPDFALAAPPPAGAAQARLERLQSRFVESVHQS